MRTCTTRWCGVCDRKVRQMLQRLLALPMQYTGPGSMAAPATVQVHTAPGQVPGGVRALAAAVAQQAAQAGAVGLHTVQAGTIPGQQTLVFWSGGYVLASGEVVGEL